MATQRLTKQRKAITEALASQENFRSAQEIHALLTVNGEAIGLSTVYRNLTEMFEARDVDMIIGTDGESQYRLCSSNHHHHLTCSKCGLAIEITAEALEVWAKQVGTDNGFTDIAHTLEITGICRTCKKV
jgi:Fur family transcriptional regulator, ferric uptake regulator